MDCTDIQKQQVEVLLGYASNELQLRCSQRNLKAIAALAYACHNLPSAHRNPSFDLDYFYKWFGRFHDDHGFMYDYLSMLDAIRDGSTITGELAIGKWGAGLDALPLPEPPALAE